MRLLTRVGSIFGGVVVLLVAIAMYVYTLGPLYREGSLHIGILAVLMGLFIVVSNVCYIRKEGLW